MGYKKKRSKQANQKTENSSEPVSEPQIEHVHLEKEVEEPLVIAVNLEEPVHPDTKLLDFMEETLRRSGLSGRVFIKYHHERGFTMREIMPHEAFESHGSVREAIVALKEKLDPDPIPTA